MAFSSFPPTVTYVRNARLMELVDADTYEVMIDDGRKQYSVERLRLSGVDTPEERGREKLAGLYVTEQVRKKIGFPEYDQLVINSVEFRIDSFARIICEVWVRDHMINKWLLDEGLAWPTNSRGELIVERNLRTLNLPRPLLDRIEEQ